MNFDDTPEEAAWRAEVRAWIAANRLPIPATRRRRRDATPGWLELARRWQAIKAAAGHVAIAWPEAWGGRGGEVVQQIIFDQEEAAAGLHFAFFEIGLGLCVPTVATYADPATIARLVPPALRGEEIWCQLFSEPAVGSDLAGVRTRAVSDGDEWVIDGQKVWTSGGQYADYGLLIARTDPDVPKHRGLTMFWLRMDTPGVEVRPIRQMSGVANFNEVFLSGVRIPDAQRVGAVGQGWQAVITALMNERVSIGDVGGPDLPALFEMARAVPGAIDDAALRHAAVDHYIKSEGVRLTRARMLTAISRGEKPGPENAISKLVAANAMQTLAREALLSRGAMGMVLERGEGAGEGIFHDSFTWSPGYRIAGGADEILRTVIAERVLGLPAEPRADKDRPFRQV